MREEYLTTAVEDIDLESAKTLEDLLAEFKRTGGFTARKIATALEIVEEMIQEEATIFLSFPGAIVATGTRGVLRDLVKRKVPTVIVTTCGSLDHDLARCWKPYYHGSFQMDDAALHDHGINRLGNVLVPNESYGTPIEERMQTLLQQLWDEGIRNISPRELIESMGRRVCNESSIMYWAAERGIPIYVPGITDGAVGYQIWSFWQDHKELVLNQFQDEKELADIVYEAERVGAIIIGGGISKHHVIWWNQFRGGLDYAVYITTAVEYDGSLSGARMREGISWGKVKSGAKRVTVEGDATTILPLLAGALFQRLDSLR